MPVPYLVLLWDILAGVLADVLVIVFTWVGFRKLTHAMGPTYTRLATRTPFLVVRPIDVQVRKNCKLNIYKQVLLVRGDGVEMVLRLNRVGDYYVEGRKSSHLLQVTGGDYVEGKGTEYKVALSKDVKGLNYDGSRASDVVVVFGPKRHKG